MTVDKLSEALEQFVNTEDWDEARQVVEQNRELMSDEAVNLLQQSVKDYRESGRSEVANYLEEHLNILKRSREAGVEEAFNEANQRAVEALQAQRRELDTLRPTSPTPIQSAVWQLLDADTPEAVDRALSENPQLSQQEESVNYLDELTRQAQERDLSQAERILGDYRDLLQAFFELPPLMMALQEFMSVPTWSEAGEVIKQNPDLLGDESLQNMDSLIAEAEAQGDQATADTLRTYRQVIARAREAGIDQAIQEAMEAPQPSPAP